MLSSKTRLIAPLTRRGLPAFRTSLALQRALLIPSLPNVATRRTYADKPGGGGGFKGFKMNGMGGGMEEGEALKQFVRLLFSPLHLSVKKAHDRFGLQSIDLTAMAKEGKMDPVIGRDDEIKRTIQSKVLLLSPVCLDV